MKFLTPHLVLFVPFLLLPIGGVLVMSGFDWNLLGGYHFVGLSNYAELLEDRDFWRALLHTIAYAAAIVPATMAIGLALAVALNERIRGRNLFRAAIYLPTVISGVASGIIAAWIFQGNYGVLNAVLAAVGWPRLPWLSSTTLALPSVILSSLWLRIGLCMVIYLAALQDVPRDQMDAAALDGASAWNRFRHVAWPVLAPATTFLLVTNLIYSLHVFDLVYVMTEGGPAGSTTMLVQYLYEAAFYENRLGYGSAIGVVLMTLLIALTSVLLWRRRAQP